MLTQEKGRATALSVAAKHGHFLAVQLLLNKGAAIEAKKREDHDALYWAQKNNHWEVAHFLKTFAQQTKGKVATPPTVKQGPVVSSKTTFLFDAMEAGDWTSVNKSVTKTKGSFSTEELERKHG
eukprot:gene24295-31605_t